MPWPPKVLRQFEKVPPALHALEADYHGPHNKLLYSLFPADTNYTVVPQYLHRDSRDPADFLFLFEVFFEDKTVLILEIKAPGTLRYASSRKAADRQIRKRIRDVYRVLSSICLGLLL